MKEEIRGPVLNFGRQGTSAVPTFDLSAKVTILKSVISAFKTGPRISSFSLLFSLLLSSAAAVAQSPPLKIGLIADIQYCDCPTAGSREYAESIVKLDQAMGTINRENVTVTVELGDMIDRDFNSFGPILEKLNLLDSRWIFIPGNHDFNVPDSLKEEIWSMIPARKGYWSEVIGNIRMVYLNGLQNSVIAYRADTKDFIENRKRLDDLEKKKAPNAYDWNGGLGPKQLDWLKGEVVKAKQKNQKLILFCHQPAVPNEVHSLWDADQLIEVLAGYPHQALYLCGHNHSGGDDQIGNTRIINLKGMVEKGPATYGVLLVYEDRWELRGYGRQEGTEGRWK